MPATVSLVCRETRLAALVGIVGALAYLGVAVVQAASPIGPGAPGFALRNTVSTVAALLLVGTLVGLARCGATGDRWPARIGLVGLAVGWVTIAAAQAGTQIRGEEITLLYAAATAVHVLAMIPVAWAVLRARVWTGLRRWAPLLSLVVLMIATPLFALPGAQGHLAIAAWGFSWLLLGLAVHTGRPAR